MSHFSNISAFMAVGKRFTLDIKIFGWDGKPLHICQIDVGPEWILPDFGRNASMLEAFVLRFSEQYDSLFQALNNYAVAPCTAQLYESSSWLKYKECNFELYEYLIIERFVAIANLVNLLNRDS